MFGRVAKTLLQNTMLHLDSLNGGFTRYKNLEFILLLNVIKKLMREGRGQVVRGWGDWNGFHPIYLIVICQTDNENIEERD